MNVRRNAHWRGARFARWAAAVCASVVVVAAVTAGVGASAGASAPVSLWPSTNPPAADASQSDAAAVTLGVKFSASTAGTVVGVRFYKGAGNRGTHVGDLWSASGQKLAEATFTGEGATGWQKVLFAAPVAVAANTTYVASYHAPAGHYAETVRYFQSAYTNGVLMAPASSSVSGNGVYVYGANAFPRTDWAQDNYWVDVLFSAGSTPPPTTTTTSGGTTTTVPVTTTTAKPTSTTTSTVRSTTTTTTRQSGQFPSAANTGVPTGKVLTAYSGPSVITTCGTVIDSKIVTGLLTIKVGNGTHSSATPCVTIKNSLIRGMINDGYAAQNYGPLLLTDDELDAGQQFVKIRRCSRPTGTLGGSTSTADGAVRSATASASSTIHMSTTSIFRTQSTTTPSSATVRMAIRSCSITTRCCAASRMPRMVTVVARPMSASSLTSPRSPT